MGIAHFRTKLKAGEVQHDNVMYYFLGIEGDKKGREARDSPSPDYPEYKTPSYHKKTTDYLSKQVITGLSRPYLNTSPP